MIASKGSFPRGSLIAPFRFGSVRSGREGGWEVTDMVSMYLCVVRGGDLV